MREIRNYAVDGHGLVLFRDVLEVVQHDRRQDSPLKLQVPGISRYARASRQLAVGIDDCREALLNLDVPVCYMFGSEDPVFADHLDSSIWAIKHTRHTRTVILNGERHLMEIDAPERVAQECIDFFDSARTDWFADEPEGDAVPAPTVDVASSTDPDPDLAGTWRCAFNGPMGTPNSACSCRWTAPNSVAS